MYIYIYHIYIDIFFSSTVHSGSSPKNGRKRSWQRLEVAFGTVPGHAQAT